MRKLSLIHNLQSSSLHPAQPHALDPSIFFERPERLSVFLEIASQFLSDQVVIEEHVDPVDESDIHLVHSPKFVESFREACKSAGTSVEEFGAEFFVSNGTFEAACSAVACALQGVREVLNGFTSHAVSLCRPPGHHSEPDRCMGFCGFSTAAIAALYARKLSRNKGVASRICVIDYDVHSGNGTIKALQGESEILFAEIRTMTMDAVHTPVRCRAYPYPPDGNQYSEASYPYVPSGGNIIVEDMYLGATGDEYLERFRTAILPYINSFDPTLIIISAGFDAMIGDPLGDLGLEPRHIQSLVSSLVRTGVSSVTVLEGGYDLDNNRAGFAGHLRGLLGSS